MFYRFSSICNRLVVSSQMQAYQPQGLVPLAKVVQPTPIVSPYESPVSSPALLKSSSEGSVREMATSPSGVPYAPLSPRIKELQELFQEDDGVPIHLKRGSTDNLIYTTTLVLAVVGTLYTTYAIGMMALPKKA